MKCPIFLMYFVIMGASAKDLLNSDVLEKVVLQLNSSEFGTSECTDDLVQVLRGLNGSLISWAWKMLDASSKVRSGIEVLSDDIGQFDECIQARSENNTIRGKYCLGKISLKTEDKDVKHIFTAKQNLLHNAKALGGIDELPTQKLAFTWAGCLPNSCSSEFFNKIFTGIFNQISSKGKFDVLFDENLCSTLDDESELSTGAIITIIIFSFIFLIMVLETCYDLYCQYKNKEAKPFFIAFSMYTNSAKLFKMSKASNQLECLNGLKFYSMMWVILGHTYALSVTSPLASYEDVLEWADSLHSMLVVSGTLSVDTFFVVGGTLVSYVYMQAKEKGQKFNIFLYYLHRYIRLTPALAAIVLVTTTVYPYLGNGPYWSNVRMNQKLCQDSWWSTLLYVQNYATAPSLCVGVSWYISVDMQLYIVSPIILYGLKRFTKWTILVLIGLILILCGFNFVVAWNKHYYAILSNIYVDFTEYLSTFYIKTHVRAGAWILGIIVGFIIFEIKQKRLTFRMHKILNYFLWLVFLCLLLTCIFIGHTSLRTKYYDAWGNSLHIALVRQLWAVGIGWIIISCVAGSAGPINWVLSLPVYQVMNKFSYSVYLLHYSLITLWSSSTRAPIHFSDIMMGYYFWGNLCFTTVLSYFWVMAFESPVIILEKILLGPLIDSKRKTQI